MYLLNKIYYYGGEGIEENEAEAWRWAKLGAERNSHLCYTALGNMCRDGYGMEGCTRKDCVRFYERAVYLQSSSDAGIELYKIYSEGRFGFPRDMEKAVAYLKPVAESNIDGALHYGKLLTDIDSDYCDEFLGVKYLTTACEAGYAEAYYRLGKLYEVGFGVPQDNAKAQELIQKSRELGYEE
jgi:TPR repeat protein